MSNSKSNNANITQFFPSIKKTDTFPNSARIFYENKLLEASNTLKVSEDQNLENIIDIEKKNEELLTELCAANKEILQLKEKVRKQEKDIKSLKYLVNTANRLCVSKDLTIERIMSEKNNTTCVSQPPSLFKKFEENLDITILKKLRGIQIGQKHDSTFIRMLIQHIYKDDIKILLNKTSYGNAKGKTAVSPVKKLMVQEMLKERVISEENDEIRVDLRVNRVGSLINDAISNIGRNLKQVT